MMYFDDIPANQQARVMCSIMAAIKYEVPVNIVLAVAEKEGGRPYARVKNTNGSYDVGVMQFNTVYIKDLKKYGIREKDLEKSGCYSYDLAAWRLRMHEKNDGRDMFTSAANYHSKTPKYNLIYRLDLIKKSAKWQHWLQMHFLTYPIQKAGIAQTKFIAFEIDKSKTAFDKKENSPFVLTSYPIHSQKIESIESLKSKAKQRLDAIFSNNHREGGI